MFMKKSIFSYFKNTGREIPEENTDKKYSRRDILKGAVVGGTAMVVDKIVPNVAVAGLKKFVPKPKSVTLSFPKYYYELRGYNLKMVMSSILFDGKGAGYPRQFVYAMMSPEGDVYEDDTSGNPIVVSDAQMLCEPYYYYIRSHLHKYCKRNDIKRPNILPIFDYAEKLVKQKNKKMYHFARGYHYQSRVGTYKKKSNYRHHNYYQTIVFFQLYRALFMTVYGDSDGEKFAKEFPDLSVENKILRLIDVSKIIDKLGKSINKNDLNPDSNYNRILLAHWSILSIINGWAGYTNSRFFRMTPKGKKKPLWEMQREYTAQYIAGEYQNTPNKLKEVEGFMEFRVMPDLFRVLAYDTTCKYVGVSAREGGIYVANFGNRDLEKNQIGDVHLKFFEMSKYPLPSWVTTYFK